MTDIDGAELTYGYITKNARIELGIDKTLQRARPILYTQVRRNNSSFEKFYDSKVMDTLTGKKVSDAALYCGHRIQNKEKNGENLRIYRGEKISKEQRRIRTQRYPYQTNDLVRYEGEIVRVVGTCSKGKSVNLANYKY